MFVNIYNLMFVLLLFSWNVTLLFDGNVSSDFDQYQKLWLQSSLPLVPFEWIFRLFGFMVSSWISDFRWFFVIFNLIFYVMLIKKLSLYTFTLLLFSPFAVLGMGNTVLMHTAGLFWLIVNLDQSTTRQALFTEKVRKFFLNLFSLSFHKGAIFLLISLSGGGLILLVSCIVFLLSSNLPYIAALSAIGFQTPLFEVCIKFFAVYFGPLLLILIRSDLKDEFFKLIAIFSLVMILFYVSSKLSDRVVSALFFHGLYLFERISLKRFKSFNFFVVKSIWFFLLIALLFFSGSYDHLPSL